MDTDSHHTLGHGGGFAIGGYSFNHALSGKSITSDKKCFYISAVSGRNSEISRNWRLVAMEKRSFARIPFQTKAIVRSKNSTVIGIVENLSLAGIFLKTPERLGINRLVKIELLFTGTSSQISIILDGKITRHQNIGMGVEFKNIDLDAFIHLKNLITYNTENNDTLRKEFQEFSKKQNKTE